MFIGHNHLIKDFKNLTESGRLAHGYIFFGEPEVGKFYFAKHLANFLENSKATQTHESTRIYEADPNNEGQFKISERLLQDALILEDAEGIEEMKQIKNFLWQKPAISNKRLVIINNAENLTDQAQAAILKITEEPPEHSLIILIVNQPENLLPALQSRLQKIYFGRLSDEEMRGIVNLKPSTLDLKTISESFGRPGRAMRLKDDALTGTAEDFAKRFLAGTGFVRSKLIKELIDLQKDLSDESDKESLLLDYFFESLILKLRREPVRNCQLVRSVLHRLFLIKSYNTNKRLQIEAI